MPVLLSLGLDRAAEVSAGDWFKYEFCDVRCNSTSCLNGTFPPRDMPNLAWVNETAWFLRSVQKIDNRFNFTQIVTFQNLIHFKNETEKIESGSVDIASGEGNMSFSVISANLDVNDLIYDNVLAIRINDTMERGYPNGVRETVHANRTLEMNETITNETGVEGNEPTINGTMIEVSNYYWDRPTGVLVEFSYQQIERIGDYVGVISYAFRIVESNVFAIEEFPAFLILPLTTTVALVTFVSATILRKKNRWNAA